MPRLQSLGWPLAKSFRGRPRPAPERGRFRIFRVTGNSTAESNRTVTVDGGSV